MYCYASYEEELRRIFGSRHQPFIKSGFSSTSQVSLCRLNGLDTFEQTESLSASNEHGISSKNNQIQNKFAELNGALTNSVTYLRPVRNTLRGNVQSS